ncbi:MAG: phosphotransferase [Rheinheimera sp.]|nr:phosphotransferase [Rheinheimera sp.]
MAQQLPVTATEQQIWHLCQRLEFFANHLPLALQKLATSSTNDNYYIHTQRGHYLLRHYASFVTGVCRQQELRCQHAAAAVGIAAAPLCLNNHQRILITEFLTHSRHFSWDLHAAEMPQLISQLVKMHQLKVQTPVLDAQLYLPRLREQIPADVWQVADEGCYQHLAQVASQFSTLNQDMVLCHMDLHSGNILMQQQKLWFIDFEYCQKADSCFDLAALIINLDLNPQEEAALLAQYVKARPSAKPQLEMRLALAKQLYIGFCWLWYLCLPGAQQKAALAKQKLQQLANCAA